MRIDRTFNWLGRFPLGVDLADTVRVVGSRQIELLVDDASLTAWVAAEVPRYPAAEGALGHLGEVRELRDAVRDVLFAQTNGRHLPSHQVATLNEASATCPSFPTLTRGGLLQNVEVNTSPFDIFRATVARSTMKTLNADATALAVCHAPSCGMFFVPADRRQTWCSPGCGNRARVARHAARTGNGARDG